MISKKPLRLACDASPYGVGAVISHLLPSREEHPIAFASRTLTASEQNYSQIEKEALSIVFGVKKFYKYLYGQKFHLLTDHKPVLAVLGTKSATPTLAALRMQRWALTLLAYDYDIEYRWSSDHTNADALFRLPCKQTSTGGQRRWCFKSHSWMNCRSVQKILPRKPKKKSYVKDENLKPFLVRKDKLSTDQGCILWGSRLIIPPKYRERLMSELHKGHPGVVRMKTLARGYLWWPGLNNDIQNFVSKCAACELEQKQPLCAPLGPWSWTTTPWERIHIDYSEIDKQHF